MNGTDLTAIQAEYEEVREQYEAFADALRVLLVQLTTEAAIEIEVIASRAKDVTSLMNKIRRKVEYTGLGDVVDKCGLRIVTRYQADVDRVCALITDELSVLEVVDHGSEEIQSFGYASRHLVVKLDARRGRLREWRGFKGLVAEIQVRSILQHAWASISHGLDYTTRAEIPASVRRQLFRVAALLETGDELFDSFREDVEQLKTEYREDVERDEWRGLALDHDSLQAAWARLPMNELVTVAKRNGWRKRPRDATHPPFTKLELKHISRVITVAAALHIDTLGKLADEIASMTSGQAQLKAVADLAREKGDAPPAVAPVIVTALLLTQDSQGHAADRLRKEGLASSSPLLEATEALAQDKSG